MVLRRQRRASDAIRAVDRLLEAHLRDTPIGTRPLISLAAAMATEYSNAQLGLVLLDTGEAGLVPMVGLGADLKTPQTDADYDTELTARAHAAGRPAKTEDRLAVPIVAAGRIRGVLYLEGVKTSSDVVELAESAAARIGVFLQSGDLVSERAKRHKDLRVVESLAACLAAGKLGRGELDQALTAVRQVTESAAGILCLVDADGRADEILMQGDRKKALGAKAQELSARLGDIVRGVEPDAPPELFESLFGDASATSEGFTDRYARGYLYVADPMTGSYTEDDRTSLRALAHLLEGALARRDHFRRAARDPLTGAGSRLALQITLDQLHASAERTGQPFSILLVDLDGFKEVNDHYGHPAGDIVLRAVAGRLRQGVRAQDFLARYGGDEFLVLLPETGTTAAVRVANKLRQAISSKPFARPPVKLSLSIGVATYPDHGRDFEQLLHHGDRAMYHSKQAGRDRVTVAEVEQPDVEGQ